MHMKTILILLLTVVLTSQTTALQAASAADGDSLRIRDDVYTEEEGFFRMAYRDASDPTFMFTDRRGDFSFGVGGTVRAGAFYDIGGSIDDCKFNTSKIPVPTDRKNHFGYTLDNSNVYLKARGKARGVKIAAFLQLTSSADNIVLYQAYVSLGRFSLGKTHSFFVDLESGVRTIDLRGPNTQVDCTHPLIGYSQSFGTHWSMGVALEQPTEITSDFADVVNVSAEYNRLPDVAARVKWRGQRGHVQLGGIVRELSYWASNEGFSNATKGKSFYKYGYGLALSGSVRPSERLTISGQFVAGRGIATYIQDLSGLYADMQVNVESYQRALGGMGYARLEPAPATGGYLGAGYRFAPRIEASAVVGYCHLRCDKDMDMATDFHSSLYATVNLVYFISDNCMAGIEYANGRREAYVVQGDDAGVAGRLNACFVYRF